MDPNYGQSNQGYYVPPPQPGYGQAPPPPGFYTSAPPAYGPTGGGGGPYGPTGPYGNNTVEQDSFVNGGDGLYNNSFTDTRIRHNFVKKVYSIVTLQLLLTIAAIALIKFVDPVKLFFVQNYWILYVSMAGTIVVMLVLACCEGVARSYPVNMILLMFFTVMESILVGFITTAYKTDTVFIAAGITAAVVIGLTLFAFQTKYDFTGMGTYLFVGALVLMIFGFVCIIMRSQIASIVYAALGAGLFSMYLVFDTQLMMGGKHKYSISPEDYIMAALNIYVDIINLFLLILRLVGAAKD
jgi:FtsH-binding integral membrane protein